MRPLRLSGLAAPYEVESGDGRRLVFARGLFASAPAQCDVRLAFNHRGRVSIAHQGDESLRLHSHRDGLYFTADVWRADWADVLRTAFDRRRVFGVSVGWRDAVLDGRRLVGATLHEVSLTIGAYPAFRETWAALDPVAGLDPSVPSGFALRWQMPTPEVSTVPAPPSARGGRREAEPGACRFSGTL